MRKHEKPLPKPRTGGFKAGSEPLDREDNTQLMVDRIAAAAADGKLEEFLNKELPQNEFAGKLVSLMMGMTGMASPENHENRHEENKLSGAQPPEDLLKAVEGGDMDQVMTILKREHEKRSPQVPLDDINREDKTSTEISAAEKESLDRLMRIASENGVTMDWIITRAIKLYINEYDRTGRL